MTTNMNVLSHVDPAEVVRLTQQLIAIPSPVWCETNLAKWIAAWFTERGFSAELQEIPLREGRITHQVIGKLNGNGAGPSLMLCGHTDTSDWNGRPFREEQWKHGPFSGDVANGMLYGLGAINMKAGVAAIMLAAEAVRRSGLPLKGDLLVACVAAETGGGVGAVHLINSGLHPDFCVVTEASDLNVGVISTGYVQGKIAVAGEFKARVPYVNPIEHAAKLVTVFGPSYHPLKPRSEGGWLRFNPHSLIPGFPRMAVRGIEHFQDVTTISFDLRIVPGMTEESVREDLAKFLDGITEQDPEFKYSLIIPLSEQQPNMPAREATPVEQPVVAELIKAHQEVTGKMPVVGAGHRIGATADTCHFKGAGITCVEYGPGFIPTWPMVDECVEIDQIVIATKALALAAARIVA
jgi:acetylornithine deacetylase